MSFLMSIITWVDACHCKMAAAFTILMSYNKQEMATYIRHFATLGINDIALVGGKNASLGELYNHVSPLGVKVPDGFAVTVDGFRLFVDENGLGPRIKAILALLDKATYANLEEVGQRCRDAFMEAKVPEALSQELLTAYKDIDGSGAASVAVRSSATAEDLPQASFAGQHESYLNVRGPERFLEAVRLCLASLYTDRAIKYRDENGFPHDKVALSVGVQKMVRSDIGCSGVCFTLEPESGFRDIVNIAASWGLGENVVQGSVNPDEFLVFKPTLQQGKNAIVQKTLGTKEKWMRYAEAGGSGIVNTDTPPDKRARFALDDAEVSLLARWAMTIERHYQKPMDIEWAKDGESGEMFVLQARPETVHGSAPPTVLTVYTLTGSYPTLAKGLAVGNKIVSGKARVLADTADAHRLEAGDILVTELTSPDWDPFLQKAGGIVTDKGGRTSHASIVAREIGAPAVVGCGDATRAIRDGDIITLSCAEGKEGYVYAGKAEWKEEQLDMAEVTMPMRTAPMLIIGDPAQAFRLSFYPNRGVGLLRMEFIIMHAIGIHPMALVRYPEIENEKDKRAIADLTVGYADKKQFFIDKLCQSVATIAAAFYPKDVIVRMSDFKTNEYAHLLGGKGFEPEEENPMLGFRGASRYYHPLYKEGFELECLAMKKAREEMGLTNIKLMVPFCRTVEEGHKVLDTMAQCGLRQHDAGLEVYMMAEIPSNVLMAEAFARIFDGFSIGSNDLTQLVLGLDRDSGIVAPLFTERDPAVMKMIASMIRSARAMNKKVGLCGQAPSDDEGFAAFLVTEGIDSISFNPDALLKGIGKIVTAESALSADQ